MFELNVEMKKHCRNFREMKMGCGCLSFKRGFEYTCTFDTIPVYSNANKGQRKIVIRYPRE